MTFGPADLEKYSRIVVRAVVAHCHATTQYTVTVSQNRVKQRTGRFVRRYTGITDTQIVCFCEFQKLVSGGTRRFVEQVYVEIPRQNNCTIVSSYHLLYLALEIIKVSHNLLYAICGVAVDGGNKNCTVS